MDLVEEQAVLGALVVRAAPVERVERVVPEVPAALGELEHQADLAAVVQAAQVVAAINEQSAITTSWKSSYEKSH